MPAARQLTAPVAYHGEGPVWWPDWGGLRFVDLLAGDVLHLDGDVVTRWHVGTVAAALRPRAVGGAVVATEREFVLADQVGGEVRGLGEVFTDTGSRFNDGACDPLGNFLCGTMAYAETTGAGTLYRLSPDGAVEPVLSGVTISNGLAWTADGTRAYYIDTPTGRVDVFDSGPDGTLSGRRPFVTIDASDGYPDGLTVDAEGGVWVALWGGFGVRRYSAAGTLDEVVSVPVPKVTACTFGGRNLDELFITTSRSGEEPGENPAAGALFHHHAGVRGLPAATFAG